MMWLTITLTVVVILGLIAEALHLRRRARFWVTTKIQAWVLRRTMRAFERSLDAAVAGTDLALTPARKVTEWGVNTAEAIRDKVIDVTGGGLMSKNIPVDAQAPAWMKTTAKAQRIINEGLRNVANDPDYIAAQHRKIREAFDQALKSPSLDLRAKPTSPLYTQPIQGRSMPRTHLDPNDIMDENYRASQLGGTNSAPAEHSLNDYAKYREQDQQVSQLASQLQAIGEDPWVTCVPEDTEVLLNAEYSPVGFMSIRLCALSAPPATAGEQEQVGQRGVSALFVDMGRRKVAVATKADSAALLKRLNKDYYTYVAERRASFLKDLNEYATTGVFVDDGWRYQVKCGNTKVYCASSEDRAKVQSELNGLYMAAVADYRNKILAELAKVTEATVPMTVDHTITDNDPAL